MSQTESSQPAATQPAERKRSSPIRLIVLLAILGIVLAAFLVDMFVMYDSVNAAAERLNKAATAASGNAAKDDNAGFLPREGVAEAIGFKPTNSRVENGVLKEQYRWWGSLPLQRRFLEVIYQDEEGKRYERYEISNANIFGQDVDPEAQQKQPEQAPGDTTQPSPPMPMPGVGPMPPSKEDGESAEATPGKEESSSPPAGDSDKDDDSNDE